ncbi:MAG: hypothetical protein WA052_02390 [Microgenomates group bacterium]
MGRPDAIPNLLAKTTLNILREIIDIVFGLTESEVEHELSLRSVIKPKGRKLEVKELPCVEKIDEVTAINAVSGQPIGVPGKNGVGLVTFDFL